MGINKQPFYHRAVILFTATHDVDEKELLAAVKKLKIDGLLPNSIEIEEINAEPGDPADLL
jgi:hypothetical protein